MSTPAHQISPSSVQRWGVSPGKFDRISEYTCSTDAYTLCNFTKFWVLWTVPPWINHLYDVYMRQSSRRSITAAAIRCATDRRNDRTV